MSDAAIIAGNDLANTLVGTGGRDVIYGWDPSGPQGNVTSIAATRVVSGLTQPLFVGSAPDDPTRLFIVEKTGQIKILDLQTGTLKPNPFLDVASEIATAGEQGLLGLAFDPDFSENGFFYVNLTNTAGDTEIRRYHISETDPDRADPGSATLVIAVDQPAGRTNHKGGWLGFGPDGMLYAGLGDGGGAGDPNNNAQNINLLLGKMLRLDVGADAFPADALRNYAIPADNPFVGIAGADEIYALGLRNPWRSSFDRGTGDLFIADVGQATWEEINLGAPGANYGWKIYEGPAEFSPGTPSGGGTLTEPIFFYGTSGGDSITGGYVYRGPSEGLHGHYFFADYVDNRIYSMHFDGTAWVAVNRTAQLVPDVGAVNSPASFGQDAEGNLYVVDITGEVFRLTPNVASVDQGDRINAGGGDDLVFGGSGNDVIDGQAGEDELQGGKGDDVLRGSDGADLLFGGDGNDWLDGGGENDVLIGGAGNDTYVVDSVGDTVTEANGQGTDFVQSTVSFSLLGQDIENFALLGGDNVDGTGNALANILLGNAGNNILDGGGGADVLKGLGGNDTYVVDNIGDKVKEAGGQGTDLVQSSVSFSLSGEDIENLTLTGNDNINGIGNALANVLIGNAGNNVLKGGGGVDEMKGGAGDDTYVVDNVGDTVTEASGQGTDFVQSTVSFSLVGQDIENLALLGGDNVDGTGNVLANVLLGNAGNNILDGGSGADVLKGFGGNDTYVVDNIGDKVKEASGQGTDLVRSSVSFSLSGEDIENLILTGNDNINGSGNALANIIVGNAGNNILNGSNGADSLTGLGGSDSFWFNTTLGASNIDTIVDFDVMDDTIRLENAVFTGLATGVLADGLFFTGTAAHDANDRVIYNATNGALLFDVDGLGGAAAVQFATVSTGLSMTSADFLIV